MTGAVRPAHEEILDDLPAMLTGELSPSRERAVAEHLDGCDPAAASSPWSRVPRPGCRTRSASTS